MATQNNIKIGIDVSDNGTGAKQIKTAKEIKGAYDSAASSAAKLGGTAGSKKAASAAFTGSTGAQMSEQTYSNLRGNAGVTGASARDFANQSQGLGGLVRLYATYAANVFAVGAAFRALSAAMDTSNMVRGLDQLGAASGMALGSLSKRLVTATDGAISLREAMEATAKASSSGMSSDNILRMASAAKKASQALGVDMADAVSRMTRGITKMEPELLDELGIFVRVDDVVNEYSRSVGRAASSLTDFERRQAYANAVIGQAEKKFGEIKLDSNPYNKLLASMKDLSQAGLELINKVLTPLIGALATSPTLLATAMAGIGAILVKQALPAIGQMRAGLAASAVEAADVAKKFRESFSDEFQERLEQRFRIPNMKADIAKTESELKQLAARIKPVKYLDTDENGLLIKSTNELNKKLLDKKNIVETGMTASRKASEAEITQRKAEIAVIEKALLLDKQRKELRNAFDASVVSVSDMPGRMDPETIAIMRAEKLQQRADKTMAISNAAQNAQIMGIRGSWELLNQEISDKGIKGITKYTALAQGGLAAVGSRVMGIVSSFGHIGVVVGLVAGAFAAVDAYFSKNKEQVASFDKAIERTDASLKNLSNTLEYIAKRPVLEQLNPSSMLARSNAVKEVTASLDESVNTLMAVDAAAGKWDKFIDGWKTVWGGDVLSKFSDSAGKTIDGMLKKLGNSAEAEKFKQVLADELKISPQDLNINTIEEAIKKLGKNAPNALKDITKGFNNISTAMQVTAAKGTEMEAAFAKSAEMQKTMADKLKPSDDMTKYGQALIDQFKAVSLALDDPQQKLNAIRGLAKSMQELPGTTLSEALDLKALAKDAEKAQAAQLKLEEVSKKIVEVTKEKRDLGTALTPEGLKQLIALNNELKELQAQREVLITVKTELSGKIEAGSKLIEQAQLKVFEIGASKISSVLSAEWAKAGAAIGSAYATILSGTETGIKMRAESEKRVIGAQIAAIEEQRKNTIAVQELKLQLKRNEIEEKRKRIPEYDSTNEDKALDYEERALKAAKSGDIKGLHKKLADEMKKSEISGLDINSGALGFAQSMEASAAQVAALRAQIGAIDITADDDRVKLEFENRRKSLETQLKQLAASKDSLAVYKEAVSESNMQYLLDTQSLDTKNLQTQQAVERLAIEVEIARLERVRKSDPGVKDEIEKLKLRKEELLALHGTALLTQKQSQAVQREKAQYKGRVEAVELEGKLTAERLDRKEQELKLETDRVALLKETGALLDSAAIKASGALDARKAELDYDKQLAEAKKSRDLDAAKLESDRKIVSLSVVGEVADDTQASALAEIDAKLLQVNNTYQTLAGSILRAKDAQLEGLSALTAYKLEQQALAESIENLKSLDLVFEGLGSSVEGFGSKLAAVATTFAEGAANTGKYATAVAEAQREYDKFDNRDEGADKSAAYKKLTEAQRAHAKAEQDANLKTLNSTKKLFKEKTAAYKILDAVEKASHIMKIGMWIKEQAVHLQSILMPAAAAPVAAASNIATAAGESAATTALSIPAMIMKVGSQLGMFAFPVIAAILAMAGSGGGGKSAPAITAEMRQETQGTAMGYNVAGEKVQTSRGVFGDTDAKSESIANSLERIKETSVDGLRYDNKMVDLLSKINDGINNTAKSLYSIRGLRQGSLFDTREGTTKGKGFLGTGFFGSKTSTNITDSGVLINATFADLASTTSRAAIQFYEDVTTTKKKWYGSSKTSYSRNLETADQITQDYFNDIFSNATELFKEIGQDAGMQVEQVLSSLSGVSFANLSVSLRGLKGEDLEKELNAVISSMLDQGAEAVFSQFMQFEEFGEGMLETVIRVTDNNRKVKQALSNLGIGTLRNVMGMASFEITEALVGAAGGIQDFLAKAEDYREKFLTEAERIAPIQLEVSAEIARIAKLGFTSADGLVDTRQEFKALVSSLDLTSETGRTAYTALMNVSEGFYQVTEATETALQSTIDKFKSFADDLRAFRDSLVLGSSSILTPLQKYTESKLQLESTYASALAGDVTAQGKLTSSAQTFLTASKDYFASSSQYTQDFNSVLDKVGAGITEAEVQISLAEKQLKGIEAQLALLTTIDQNIATIAGVPQAATGGRVHGLTLVGERGPELVDFTNPGMVYPADQTRGMFAPQASMSNNIYQVVAELRQVKQELAQLRQEQRQQTGDLIVSNYDANNRAAETISAEVALTTTQKEWQERNAPAVV